MLKKRCFTLFFSLFLLANMSYGQWEQKNDFPTNVASFNHEAQVAKDTAYVVNGTFGVLNKYDFRNDAWLSDSIPWMDSLINGQDLISFVINDKIYAGGGFRGEGTLLFQSKLFYEYDPSTGRWTQKSNLPEQYESGPNNPPAFAVGGKGYILQFASTLFVYDPSTDTWTDMPTQIPYSAGFVSSQTIFTIADKAYAVGGTTSQAEPIRDFVEYTPSTNTWRRLSDYPAENAKASMFAFILEDEAYVGLGWFSDPPGKGYDSQFFRYTPSSDTWTAIEDCGYIAEEGFAFSLNGKGYVGTGIDYISNPFPIPAPDVWQYSKTITNTNQLAIEQVNLTYHQAGNFLHISDYPPQKNMVLQLFNMEGKLLQTTPVSGNQIAVKQLPSGFYQAILLSQGQVIGRKKLVISK